ncbi:MAG: hypothetical protein L0191_11850, partial [Acidobacteria bacterium]|nr:hypothetical protein [Acidobacteriota bacterium]
FLNACALLPDRSQVPGTACELVPMTVGEGTIEIPVKIVAEGATGTFRSGLIAVCMYQEFGTTREGRRGEDFYCEEFPYAKEWGSAVAQGEPICRPELTSPEENAVLEQRRRSDGRVGTKWSFSWSGCPAASRYHLYVKGPGAKNPIVNLDNIVGESHVDTSTHYGIQSLEGWTWKVRAFVEGEWGDWSRTGTFNVSKVAGVAGGSGTCAISGRVDADLPKYHSKVNLYRAGSNVPVRSVPVEGGRYSLEDVKPGQYQVAPTGNYPNDKLSIGPKPRWQDVTCKGSQHHLKSFKIVSGEG